MITVACNLCKSDLIDPGKNHDFECLYCGNEFDKSDITETIEVSMTALQERIQAIYSKKALRRTS